MSFVAATIHDVLQRKQLSGIDAEWYSRLFGCTVDLIRKWKGEAPSEMLHDIGKIGSIALSANRVEEIRDEILSHSGDNFVIDMPNTESLESDLAALGVSSKFSILHSVFRLALHHCWIENGEDTTRVFSIHRVLSDIRPTTFELLQYGLLGFVIPWYLNPLCRSLAVATGMEGLKRFKVKDRARRFRLLGCVKNLLDKPPEEAIKKLRVAWKHRGKDKNGMDDTFRDLMEKERGHAIIGNMA